MVLLAMLMLTLQLHWNERNAIFLGTSANDTKPKAFINRDGKHTGPNGETLSVSRSGCLCFCALPEFCCYALAMEVRRYKKMMNMCCVAQRNDAC